MALILIRFSPSKPKQGELVKVSVVVRHPMEPGTRKDENGQTIPANYITELEATLNGERIALVNPGRGVSANPLFAFMVKAEPGEVKVRYKDTAGETGEKTKTLKVAE